MDTMTATTWSSHMQDLSELIEDRLLSFDVWEEKQSSSELIKSSVQQHPPHSSLSQETLETLLLLNTPTSPGMLTIDDLCFETNLEQVNENEKRMLSFTTFTEVTCTDDTSSSPQLTNEKRQSGSSPTFEGPDNNLTPINPSIEQAIPGINPSENETAIDTVDAYLSNSANHLANTTISLDSNLHRVAEWPTSQEAAQNVSTTLATRTNDAVIADLRHARLVRGPGLQSQAALDQPNRSNAEDGEENFDDSEDEPARTTTKLCKATERKRVQNAKIDEHVRQHRIRKINKGVRPEDLDKLSARYLLKEHSKAVIISSPREYQLELYERAKEKNVIAVLDTGSGKTLIAVLLIRHICEQELEDRALGKPHRVTFFLVDSVTLAFQQHDVLKANLDHPMDVFCGDMNTDFWNRAIWTEHLSKNRIIVCTAEVLRHALHHSFVSINHINLLIFDEAHHAKKDHPYARIIKDFYLEAREPRPKIFGMTASPVDSKTDIKKAARELESLLHAHICTTKDPELAQYTITKSHEEIWSYSPLGPEYDTELCIQMRKCFKNNKVLRKPLQFARSASRELGGWCTDQVWLYCLGENEFKRLVAKTERAFHQKKFALPEVLAAQQAQLQKAQKIVQRHAFEEPDFNLKVAEVDSYRSKNLSTKVVKLALHLKHRFERPTEDKCIVFVERRYTARLLASLFSRSDMGTPNLFVGTLIGTRPGEVGDLSTSFADQVRTMANFRQGKLNCLFATSVAEEGLDIPDCNLVIRFDLYNTVIQYIQSRGRARHANSRYAHYVEKGNLMHANTVLDVRKSEGILKRFCDSLDDDRKLTGSDENLDYFLKKEKSHRVYIVKSTGAKLTYKMSLAVLANFCDSLPRGVEGGGKAEYIMQSCGKDFECEVILPENSPVRGAIGKSATTKQVAKCSAAFEACLALIKGKYLDEDLLPIYTKQLPVMRNAQLAVDSKKREQYTMKVKPKVWSVGGIPEKLFATIITLNHPEYLDRPSQPIALLTRTRLIQLPSFMLHFGKEKRSLVNINTLDSTLDVNPVTLSQIDTFTLCIFDDVFSKEYESDVNKMPYFFAPVLQNVSADKAADPSVLLDWHALQSVHDHQTKWKANPWDNKSWKNDATASFAGKYVIDPFDGSRKLFIVDYAPQYSPLDPVPEGSAPRTGTRKNNSNIMEYSCSLWAKSRAQHVFEDDQRVFEARLVSLKRNLLDQFDATEEESSKKCFIILETLRVSCLPSTVVTMAYILPAVLHRIESHLIALEAAELIHINVTPELALEACTKDSDNSGDHDAEQINFQRGMGKNYERLEFIGDCFLKMATSISLYGLFPGNDEYKSHVDRMLLLCNANLCNNALNLKLYEYIRSQSFNRRAWYPEGLNLKRGKKTAAPKTHPLGDKAIADVCEALIGAALVHAHNNNDTTMDQAVRAVTELVCSENHNAKVWNDYYKLYQKPAYQTAIATATQKDMAEQVEKKHDYHFQWPRLLRCAFIHPSYPYSYEKIPSYQRLEFLGDSLLDMACVNFLFYRYPDKDPQWLTEHKMAMASNQFLGALCVHLQFHTHMLSLHVSYQAQIKDYVTDIKEARKQAEDDAERAGKPRSQCAPDYWTAVRHPPKCLPDIVEAYIGAMFVDSEYDFSIVEHFFERHIRWFFEDMSIYDTYANKQPTTFLTKFLQVNMGCTEWTIQVRELPEVDGSKTMVIAIVLLHGKVIGEAEGESGRYAKIAAAKMALGKLEGLPITEFREMYGCECKGCVDEDGDVEMGDGEDE